MIRRPPEPVDFSTLRRPRRPNACLAAPAGATPARIDLPAPAFPVPADALRRAWRAMLEETPRVEVLPSPDGATVEAVQRTPILRFPDLVTARFLPLPDGGSSLIVYSRSVYGYGDFGVNRRRVRSWLRRLEERIEAQAFSATQASMPSPKLPT